MQSSHFLTALPIAHRGLHGEGIPENSVAAFRAAAQAGYAIETDVRFTRDGRLVLFHDDDLLRMTGDPRAVGECTFSQLQALRLSGGAERIPTLSDLFEAAEGRAPLLIEIKNMPRVKGKRIAEALAREMEAYRGAYAVQSFQPFYVKAFKAIRPETACGVLATANGSKRDFGGSPLWRMKASIMRNMRLNAIVKPDFISYRAEDYPSAPTDRFRGCKLAWTVRSPEEEARVRRYADNIIFEGFRPAIKAAPHD